MESLGSILDDANGTLMIWRCFIYPPIKSYNNSSSNHFSKNYVLLYYGCPHCPAYFPRVITYVLSKHGMRKS